MAANKKKTGSIDDITPEEWNEMNRKHLDSIKLSDPTVDTISLSVSDVDYGPVSMDMADVDYSFTLHQPDSGVVTITEPTINYKFREDELINEFKAYIDNTYSGHYGQGGLQSSEVIVDRGHGMGFFLGNVDKYNGRYGKKGTPSDHRKDIMKIIHYGLLALYEHDRLHGNTTD